VYRYKCWKHTNHTSIQTAAAKWSEIEKNTEKTSCARVCALQYCCRHTVNNKGVFTGHGKGLYVQKTSRTETPWLLLQYYEIWDNFPRVKRDRNILRARGDKATREDSWIFCYFFLLIYLYAVLSPSSPPNTH